MSALRERPATIVAALLSVLVLAYTIYTPTNILLGLLPVIVLLGTGYLLDRFVF